MKTIVLYTIQPVLAAGLETILATLDDFALSAVCLDIATLVECVQKERPTLVLAELTQEVTLDTLRTLKSAGDMAPVVLWVDSVATEFASQAIALGIRGILRKCLPIELHKRCLHATAAGEIWLEKDLRDRLLVTKRISLTRRERQLVGLISQGLRNKEIAYSLNITEGTVRVYLSQIFRKVGVDDRLELAIFALKNIQSNQAGDREPQVFASREGPRTLPVPMLAPSSLSIDRVQPRA